MITISNVSKWYGTMQVLKNCSTEVAKGEVVVVCGPSGSGKSTLIKCVNGLEPFEQGTITVDGISVGDPKTDLPKLPRQQHVPEGAAAASEMLKVLLKLVSEKEGVAAKIIANSDDLEKVAIDGEGADVPALHGWRRELFGDVALDLIGGKVGLRFVNKKIEAVAL